MVCKLGSLKPTVTPVMSYIVQINFTRDLAVSTVDFKVIGQYKVVQVHCVLLHASTHYINVLVVYTFS